MKDGKLPVATPLTAASLNKLAERLRNAYLEECESAECQADGCSCVTNEEHERNLARAKERKEKSDGKK